MALSPEAAARVYIVSKDPLVTRTLSKLLELDTQIHVLGEADSMKTVPTADLRPGVLILDESGEPADIEQIAQNLQSVSPETRLCMLEALRGMTLSDVLETVKHLASPDTVTHRRLYAVEQQPRRQSQHDALSALSERELEVVRLVAEGLSNKEISGRLSLSDKTVKNHISHILAKMNLTARTQVAVYAIRAGLV